MTDFDTLLKGSLLGVTKAFEQADSDLHGLVAEASQALARVTQGVAEMALRKQGEGLEGITYELLVKEARSEASKPDVVIVDYYRISPKGYPVVVGDMEKVTRGPAAARWEFRGKLDLSTKEDLQQHFEIMLSSPDSPVVTNVAFFMRRAGSAGAEAEDDPFVAR